MKIYIVIEDWSYGDESGYNIEKLFLNKSDAKQCAESLNITDYNRADASCKFSVIEREAV